MHGDYRKTTAQKLTLVIGHATVVAFVCWLLLGGGLAAFGTQPGDPARRVLLAACAVVYMVRLAVTTLVFVERSMGWSEAAIILPWVAFIHLTYAFAGGRSPREVGPLDAAALGLYVLGSFLNTGAELERRRWKKRHPGRLYTTGLFGLSRHVNYFGDSLLFTGYALLARSLWVLAIPALMTAMFVFQHIPALEKHLASKYGREFADWATRTKKFVPFVY